jgi:hypothetical protein
MARFVLAVAAAIFINYLCPAFAEDKAPTVPSRGPSWYR